MQSPNELFRIAGETRFRHDFTFVVGAVSGEFTRFPGKKIYQSSGIVWQSAPGAKRTRGKAHPGLSAPGAKLGVFGSCKQ